MSDLKDAILTTLQTPEHLEYINQLKTNAEQAGCRLITLQYVEYNQNTVIEVDLLRIGVQYNISDDVVNNLFIDLSVEHIRTKGQSQNNLLSIELKTKTPVNNQNKFYIHAKNDINPVIQSVVVNNIWPRVLKKIQYIRDNEN